VAAVQERVYVEVVEVPGLEVHQRYIEILDLSSGQRVVTVIEVLSPSSTPPDRLFRGCVMPHIWPRTRNPQLLCRASLAIQPTARQTLGNPQLLCRRQLAPLFPRGQKPIRALARTMPENFISLGGHELQPNLSRKCS
jgi:hypothetical protein